MCPETNCRCRASLPAVWAKGDSMRDAGWRLWRWIKPSMSRPNGTEIWIQCKQLQMWQSSIILASVRKLPSARFRTWPWNGEFVRRGCLAVVCRCFAASGVERKDADEQKSKWIWKGANSDQHWTKRVPKATKTEPKRCQQERTNDQNTLNNRCRKKIEKRSRTHRQNGRRSLYPWEQFFIKS